MNDLLEIVWPRRVVEESNNHVHVSALRKVLGADVISTVPGRGYRFVHPLKADRGPSAASADSGDASGSSGSRLPLELLVPC